MAVGPDGSIYAGGAFITAGDVVANHIARWDGKNWHPLGTGMSGGPYSSHIYALAMGPDGSLYAGGSFSMAGGVATQNIAHWDGVEWHALSGGVDGEVYALAMGQDGSLYAGGLFTMAGGVSAANIACWDGVDWHPLGSGSTYYVYALAIGLDGSLFAGGQFTVIGGVGANNIARWDGTNWHPLGDGIQGSQVNLTCGVLALVVGKDGILYAGGHFTTAGGAPAYNIARWDGVIWHPLRVGRTLQRD